MTSANNSNDQRRLILGDQSRTSIARRLSGKGLVFDLGPFRARVFSRFPRLVDHLLDCYGPVPLIETEGAVHHTINVTWPNPIRRFLRRQVTAKTIPQMPMVPMAEKHVPLVFEMALNFVVATGHYRHLILHAGVVEVDGGAVIMSAASGGGKSTLVANLMARGNRLLSDEFALVEPENGHLLGYPRPVSLKNDSIILVRDLLGKDQIRSEVAGTPKGKLAYVPIAQTAVSKAGDGVPPKALVFPAFSPNQPAFIQRLDPGIALTRLLASSPNYQIMGDAGFNSLMDLVESVPAFQITYRNSQESLSLFDETLDMAAQR